MREALGCGSCEGLVFKDRIPVTQNHACIQCSLFPRQASPMVKFFTSRKCNYPAHLKRYVASSCDHKSRTVSCCCWYVCRPPPWRDGTLTDSIVTARSCAHLFNCGKYGQGDTLMNEISLTLYSLHMLLFHQPVFIFSNDNKKMKNIIFQYCDSQNNKIHGPKLNLKELFLIIRSLSIVVQTGLVPDSGRSGKNNSANATHSVHVICNLFLCIR